MSVVLGCLIGATGKASAADGTDPQAAITIGSLSFHDSGEGDSVPYRAGTGSANAKLASDCNFGQPVYAPRWFAFTPTTTRTILATGALTYDFGRSLAFVGDGIAVLSANLNVIDCNVWTPERSATAGPSKVSAGAKVFIVHFSRSAFCEPDECIYGTPARSVSVMDAPAYPAGDEWRTAVPITSVNVAAATDLTVATIGPDDPDCRTFYDDPRPSVWWMFTPKQSGPLHMPEDAYGLRLAELAVGGPQWVPNPESPEFAGCDAAEGKAVQAGHTYLLFGTPGAGTANITSPSLAKSDLVVRSITAVPAAPKAGDPVAFRVTIRNQGAAPTPGVIHGVGFQIDGVQQLWTDTYAASLKPGQSVTLVTNSGKGGVPTWPATAGSHMIKATVDDVNRIKDEANEANNSLSLNLSVAAATARPDLVVTNVTANPASPAPGIPVKFSATIKNQGAAATPNNVIHGVLFTIDGVTKTWSRKSKASIPAGASVTLTADGGPSGATTWTSTPGPHTLSAAVDDQKLVAESNEANNQRQVQLNVGTIPSLPDLTLTSVSWTPATPARGAPVRFMATVKNVGTRSTPTGIIIGVSFRPNGSTIGATYSDTRTSPLRPGESTLLIANGGGTSGRWTPPGAGSTSIVAIVDDVRRVAESNEFNNTLQSTLTVN